MKILVSGCSFSSGWGFENEKQSPEIWPNLLAKETGYSIVNIAETCNSNNDIFLSTINEISKNTYDLVLVQVTALDRITTTTGPLGNKINLINFDQRGDTEVSNFTGSQINSFKKIYTTFNHSWKHFFDLVNMAETYSYAQTPVAMINGLLPWESDFWERIDKFPTDKPIDHFTKDLIQFNNYSDDTLNELIQKVNLGKEKLQKCPWVNLTESWQFAKIDTVSCTDKHPGTLSQKLFATQVSNFIKENYA
jgi:hypothetical protein